MFNRVDLVRWYHFDVIVLLLVRSSATFRLYSFTLSQQSIA